MRPSQPFRSAVIRSVSQCTCFARATWKDSMFVLEEIDRIEFHQVGQERFSQCDKGKGCADGQSGDGRFQLTRLKISEACARIDHTCENGVEILDLQIRYACATTPYLLNKPLNPSDIAWLPMICNCAAMRQYGNNSISPAY